MNGRVALVTGGGRGIGREAALLLAAAGLRVMITARSESELASVGLDYVVADLGTTEGCGTAVAETERRLGPIDVLVVNHGIGSAHERLIWEQDPAVWRETMRINLDGPFELARLTVGGMCKRGFGRLVFTSSTAGEKAEPIVLGRMTIGVGGTRRGGGGGGGGNHRGGRSGERSGAPRPPRSPLSSSRWPFPRPSSTSTTRRTSTTGTRDPASRGH